MALTKALLALALGLSLSACGAKQGIAVKPDPLPENCEASCRTPCTVDPDIKYTPVPGSKDAIGDITKQVIAPLVVEVTKVCDSHRVACVQCLDRIKATGRTQ